MIEINLLPDHSTGGKKKPKKQAPGAPGSGKEKGAIFMLGFVMFGAVVVLGHNGWSKVHEAKLAYVELQGEKATLDEEVAAHSEKAQEILRLRKLFTDQLEILNSLDPPDRVLWSEKIDMIADLMPADVFLTEIDVTENIVEVELESSIEARQKWEADGKKGPKPPAVMKPIITHTMRLAGVTTGSDNVEQFDNVIRFHDALISHESVNHKGLKRRFMDQFNPNIDFESVEATIYENVPVHEFTFTLRTNPTSDGPNETVQMAGVNGTRPSA